MDTSFAVQEGGGAGGANLKETEAGIGPTLHCRAIAACSVVDMKIA